MNTDISGLQTRLKLSCPHKKEFSFHQITPKMIHSLFIYQLYFTLMKN